MHAESSIFSTFMDSFATGEKGGSDCLPACLPAWQPVSSPVSVRPSVCLSVCLSVYLSCLFFFLNCLFVCLSVSVSMCGGYLLLGPPGAVRVARHLLVEVGFGLLLTPREAQTAVVKSHDAQARPALGGHSTALRWH